MPLSEETVGGITSLQLLSSQRRGSIYTYGDADWGDLLTAYDGTTITHDAIGNPISDGTWTYTWEHGRQLKSMSNGSTTWNYTYDASGMRKSRTNGSSTYTYVYNGGQLTQMTKGNDTLYFTYGSAGPVSVTWNGTTYYYVVNAQGDVIGIMEHTGDLAVEYRYNAWGEVTYSGYEPELAQLNPLRYRGYVYDSETGFYYLQSRYYNPKLDRFLNADAFTSTGQGILGNNMFAYCRNNPVCRKDITGTTDVEIFDDDSNILDDDKVLSGGKLGNNGCTGGNNGNLGNKISGGKNSSFPKTSNGYNTGHSVGSSQAPKQGDSGSTYTQVSSDGKNTVLSKTVYGKYEMPAYRIDYGGHNHGRIIGAHIHYFSVYVGPNGVFLNKGPIVQYELF